MAEQQVSKSSSRRVNRRRFLLGTAAVAGGGIALAWLTREQDSLRASDDILEPNAFLQITPDGRFIFQLDRVEMGQGTLTGLVTLVAEELDVDPARFDVQFAPVMSTFQRPLQMTGQSRSMTDSWELLRETGAAAREMLLEEAGERWALPPAQLQTSNGVVLHPDGQQQFLYAELATGAAARSVPWAPRLKSPDDYKYIGKHVPRLESLEKVTGRAGFGIDVQLPDMLTAVVVRCPELGGELLSVDAEEARTRPGIVGIVELPEGRGVAVVAEDFWSAKQAATSITLGWNGGPLKGENNLSLRQEQRRRLESGDIAYETREGDVMDAFLDVAAEIDVEYSTSYLAHACMEPMNATVHMRPDGCDIWAPTQAPDMARQVACDITGLQRSQVQVHCTYLGGGFGRRVMWDFIEESVWIAQEFDVPVKLIWTREDDIRHGYFRQQTLHRMRGALDETGAPLAWEHRQVATPTGELLTPPTISAVIPESVSTETRLAIGEWMGRKTVDWMGAFQAREGAVNLAYAVPHTRFAQTAYDPGVPISIWRSVGNTYNGFVVESFIDELAHAAGWDPLEYRRAHLQSHPRHLAVIDRLAEVAGWREKTRGRGKGVAVFESFGTVVGQVAEVAVNADNSIRVHKVTCVVDCGLAVNPDIVRQQMESAIIFGLTAALYGEINIDGGQVRQSNFHDYRMVKLADSPDIEVFIMEGGTEPAGIGEPGTPVIAPAVANAVFALTGERLRSLPLRLNQNA
jgi:isoquinoline 1-oxidoreductase/isoquinoline 1-oxidoreductase beta subunit